MGAQLCNDDKPTPSKYDTANLTSSNMPAVKIYKQGEMRFEGAIKVISSAQKYIITVPEIPGEPLVNPETQEEIKDWKGNPVGKEGVVFFNEKDGDYQAAQTDGNRVIILNGVTKELAKELDYIIAAHSKDGTSSGFYDYKHLKACLKYAQKALGITDMYNSTNEFVSTKMSHVETEQKDKNGNSCGLMKRDDKDICEAIYIKGNFILETRDRKHHAENGIVVIRQGDRVRGIQLDVFMETYKKADGSKITLEDLPLFDPEEERNKNSEQENPNELD